LLVRSLGCHCPGRSGTATHTVTDTFVGASDQLLTCEAKPVEGSPTPSTHERGSVTVTIRCDPLRGRNKCTVHHGFRWRSPVAIMNLTHFVGARKVSIVRYVFVGNELVYRPRRSCSRDKSYMAIRQTGAVSSLLQPLACAQTAPDIGNASLHGANGVHTASACTLREQIRSCRHGTTSKTMSYHI
jgi:hypothetical protein